MKTFKKLDYLKNPNRGIVDQDLNPVSVINTDYQDPHGYVNVIVINPNTENNTITRANNNGQTLEGGQLFFKSQTLVRWVSIYKYDNDVCCGNNLYLSQKEADDMCNDEITYIGAFKVAITIP